MLEGPEGLSEGPKGLQEGPEGLSGGLGETGVPTYRHTDKQNFYRICPLSGLLPKKQGKGSTDLMMPSATGSHSFSLSTSLYFSLPPFVSLLSLFSLSSLSLLSLYLMFLDSH